MKLTLLKTALRDQWRRPWMTLLVILSVALGVAVVVSVDLANASAARAFKLSTDAVVGKATHQIIGGTRGINESVYRDLRIVQGYRLSAPIVEDYAIAKELGAQTFRILGVDLFAEAPFRTYLTANTTQVSLDAFAAFLTQPNSALVSAASAERYGVKPGDTITLVIDTTERPITIVGLLRPPNDISARALDNLILTDISTAQELAGMPSQLTRIDLIATNEQAQTLAAQLPAGLRIVPASEQAETITQLTAAFQLNLTAFSLLALAVGMFLIYNTTLFSVVQRRRVLGILRCVGVTGWQIFALILLEAAISGVLGAIIGIGLGILLGRFTVALVTQTINDLYFSVTVRGVDVDTLSILKGILLGVLSALVAAALPAAEAASVPAITVLQRSDLESRLRRFIPALTLLGLALIAIGAAALGSINNVTVSFAGIFLGLFGITLGVPLLTIALMRGVTQTLGRVGLLSRMAARTITQALSRTSVAIAALMVAVSVVIGVTVMIASFRTTVVNWLDQTLTADIYISPPITGGNRPTTMDAALGEKIRAVKNIRGSELIRNATAHSPELGDVRVIAVTAVYNRVFKSTSTRDVWSRVANGSIAISEPLANRFHLREGDTITLQTDRGAKQFPIVGVYFDYSSDQGIILLSLDVYRQLWDDPNLSAVAIYAAPNADEAQVENAIRAAVGNSQVVVQSNKSLRGAALVIFDRTFAITATLRIIAVVVAFIGVLSALMALQLERTRELGTLRATGMTLRQLWRLTLLESGLMGATAGILAIPTGLLLSAILIYVINLRSFGWTIFFEPVPEVYAQALVIAILAALLAAVYPMIRLGRLQVADALREE